MGAVTARWIGAVLALTPPDGFLLIYLEFHRLESGALVGSIAKGRVSRTAAGTPPVGTGFDRQRERLRITNNRFLRHGDEPYPDRGSAREGNRERHGNFRRREGYRCLIGRTGSDLVHPRIPLRGNLMHEGRCQPSKQDDRRGTDKFGEAHRIFRKCLPFPEAVFASIAPKMQPQRSPGEHRPNAPANPGLPMR